MQNPSATTSYGIAVRTFDMKDAFKTNFDSVAASGYDSLKKEGLTYVFSSCTNVSVVTAIADYDYCANTFEQVGATSMVSVKDYTGVSGVYTLKFTASHSTASGYELESVDITVTVQNNCDDVSFIQPFMREMSSDSFAEIGSTQTGKSTVSDAEADRTKKIHRLELSDSTANVNCLPKFSYVLKSA